MAETLAIAIPIQHPETTNNPNVAPDLSPEDIVFFQGLGKETLLLMDPSRVEGGEENADENGQVLENDD